MAEITVECLKLKAGWGATIWNKWDVTKRRLCTRALSLFGWLLGHVVDIVLDSVDPNRLNTLLLRLIVDCFQFISLQEEDCNPNRMKLFRMKVILPTQLDVSLWNFISLLNIPERVESKGFISLSISRMKNTRWNYFLFVRSGYLFQIN